MQHFLNGNCHSFDLHGMPPFMEKNRVDDHHIYFIMEKDNVNYSRMFEIMENNR